MQKLAREMLDRERLRWFGILDAYRSGCPPLITATESQQRAFHAFNRVSRSNFARPIVRAPAERMAVRAIRTAAANDDAGDEVAWRYWTGLGLDVAATDVHSDMLTFREAYVRAGVDSNGQPVAMRVDPRFVVTYENPLNPQETVAALELLWDELSGMDYAVLSLPGEQWVAARERKNKPTTFSIPGLDMRDRRRTGMAWFPRLSFDPASFTMRPLVDDVPEDERDGGMYSQRFDEQAVSIVKFQNRDNVGEFEEHLDLLDRLFFLTMLLMVTAGVQAYKQRALEQGTDSTADRLPDRNPETGERIDWDEVFQPGPDALWKLPPGVKIWESGEVQLQPLLSAIQDTIKQLSATTSTPFSLFSPDGVNQSAEGAQLNREGLVFKVEDRCNIAARSWSRVLSLLFRFAPDEDRYDAAGNDRSEQGKIVLDWKPAERYSLAERSQADSQNKSLSAEMAAVKIWGLTADEAEINRVQRNADIFAAAAVNPQQASGANANAG
jgi:hypothetical protein